MKIDFDGPFSFKAFTIEPIKGILNEQKKIRISKYFNKNGVRFKIYKNLEDFEIRQCSDCKIQKFKIDYRYYRDVNNYELTKSKRHGGAYIFRTLQKKSSRYNKLKEGYCIQGKLVSYISLKRKDILTDIIIYHDSDYIKSNGIEIDTFVNSIRMNTNLILTVSQHNLVNNGIFYTDANGLMMQKRQMDIKPYKFYTQYDYVPSNYYPVNSHIYIENDQKDGMGILVDRSEGGSSLQQGSIELMIHRRLKYDDGKVMIIVDLKGMDEAIDQNIQVQIQHYLIFSNDLQDVHSILRQKQIHQDTKPIIFSSQLQDDFSLFDQIFGFSKKRLSSQISPNASIFQKKFRQILKNLKIFVQPLKGDYILMRIQNMDPNTKHQQILFNQEDGFLQSSILNDLCGCTLRVNKYEETQLTGVQNQIESLKERFQYGSSINFDKKIEKIQQEQSQFENKLEIELDPLEIRTFLVEISFVDFNYNNHSDFYKFIKSQVEQIIQAF